MLTFAASIICTTARHLRPRSAATASGTRGLLRRLIPKVWAAFPRPRVRVRLDGGFATPTLFDELKAAGVDFRCRATKRLH